MKPLHVRAVRQLCGLGLCLLIVTILWIAPAATSVLRVQESPLATSATNAGQASPLPTAVANAGHAPNPNLVAKAG